MAIRDKIKEFIDKYLKKGNKQAALTEGTTPKVNLEVKSEHNSENDFNESIKVQKIEDMAKEVFEDWKKLSINENGKAFFESMENGVVDNLVGDLIRISKRELDGVKYDDKERIEKTKQILSKNMDKFKLRDPHSKSVINNIEFDGLVDESNPFGAHSEKTSIIYNRDNIIERSVKLQGEMMSEYGDGFKPQNIDFIERTIKFNVIGKNEACPGGYYDIEKKENIYRVKNDGKGFESFDDITGAYSKYNATEQYGSSSHWWRVVDDVGSNYHGTRSFSGRNIRKDVVDKVEDSYEKYPKNWNYELDIIPEINRENLNQQEK